ncbi:MAG: NAD(P)/FAD-dependent oxidoreductase [Chloroflexi bacterium]|nr:NAD(P)/FAD-dependent oxidoreductase [Chloroflexota bacterium]
MSEQYDAIIIGGGHNGLTTAAYLARANKRVLVLERRHILGGATVTEEIYPGFRYTVCSYVVSLLESKVIRDLDLPRHGLEIIPEECLFTPLPDGDRLLLWGDADATRREICRHSAKDAEAYEQFGRLMYHMALAIKPIFTMIPPDPTSFSPRDLRQLLQLGGLFTSLDEKQFHWLVKLMTMSVTDFLSEWFESEALIASLSAAGIIGTFVGPRSPGSAYVLLHHYLGEVDGATAAWGFPRGGTGAVSQAIASAAREHGAEIRTNAAVDQVIVKNGRAVGVALENGDELYSKLVISGVDPKRTFLNFVDENQLPSDFVDSIRKFKIRGSSGKVNLALSELPNFTAMPGPGPHMRGSVSIGPTVDYLERAYDDAKYGRFSQRPWLGVVFPTSFDPTMAPPGQHVASIFVQYAPYNLEGGWNDAQREAFGDTVIDTLAEYAPNIRDIILHRQVLTPWDMEQKIGLTEGNIFHGELALHQLFFLRPAPKWAKFRTPIVNYYQCGSGAHPGGGITGAPGRLAAMEILRSGR